MDMYNTVHSLLYSTPLYKPPNYDVYSIIVGLQEVTISNFNSFQETQCIPNSQGKDL